MWYDLVVLGILVFAAIRGAVKGIVWQLATIAAIVLCFAFAESASAVIAPHIGVEPPLNRWIAMFILYMGFALVSFAAARVLRDAIEKAKFVEFDRHLGAVLGLLKGVVFSLVLTFFLVTLSENARAQVMVSRSGHAAAIIMDRLHVVMPDELHEVLDPYIHQLDRPGMGLKHSHHPGAGHTHDHHDGNDHSIAAHSGASDTPAGTAGQGGEDPFTADATSLTPPDAAVMEMLRDISRLYFDFPAAQDAYVEEIESQLLGLPDAVQFKVLEDWHADLMLSPQDPDPSTSLATALDERIARQVSAAEIPWTRLGESLRDRLRDAILR